MLRIVVCLLIENNALSLRPTIEMFTFQLNFVSEIYLMDLVLLNFVSQIYLMDLVLLSLEKYL